MGVNGEGRKHLETSYIRNRPHIGKELGSFYEEDIRF